jgi:hypothetical protein
VWQERSGETLICLLRGEGGIFHFKHDLMRHKRVYLRIEQAVVYRRKAVSNQKTGKPGERMLLTSLTKSKGTGF